ncbi:thioesterase superfamily protein [Caldalkalibacillus thermarum TA2.A1]|uniref:Thioesterase superfamily protein n=2 Tax=Caldalkalibacillus thermarum (strain TA2.A1) TaxID=986075 RepID=F5L909_CALTT|nr:acyl-CoA thioesterase [Caldalkalibacillus thermarum]EGL82183.1 thioesterase superfamily protein [Caldalkalibacillus thermarum TA2.A1]GGK15722.1 putative acyl-CoA thioester hydrolase YkhA [Caldalkalibacillus thermarum]
MNRERRSMNVSRTVLTKIVLPGDTNNHNTLFGGLLMKYIDEVAAIAAKRHTQRDIVTASIDGVHFHKPILSGHIVTLEAYVSSVGHTSVEVFVKIMTEDFRSNEQTIAATSFLTFVALDEHGKPAPVPEVYPETEEQKFVFKDRHARREARQKKRIETNKLIKALGS